MTRITLLFLLMSLVTFADDPVVFKNEVAMTRVDAQVVGSTGRPIVGLQVKDFVLRVDGKPQPIRNFLSESMPVDVLLLLDVSGSMQAHVERIADASQTALRVLTPNDRVAVMVFDTRTRLKLPFRSDHGEISEELHSILRSESFNGGTHITNALLDAAKYVQKQGRPDARRAIVILTDDETQDGQDEPRVEQALDESNAVLSFLRAPYVEDLGGGRGAPGRHGSWGGSRPTGGAGNGPWDESGGSWPGGGNSGPGSGSRLPGGVTVGGGDASHSAGTADIASDSGGDVIPVDRASALEDTLASLRQRYALHFYWPSSSARPEERLVTVALSRSAGVDYPNAQVRYRRAYVGTPEGRRSGTLVEVSRQPDSMDPENTSTAASSKPKASDATTTRRSIAVDEHADSGPILIDSQDKADPETPVAAPTPPPVEKPQPAPPVRKGWPNAADSPQ